jgi:hypothetical protein
VNAYDVLTKIGESGPIEERTFYRLIADFRRDFLQRENYSELVAVHRNPTAFKNELLRKLYDECQSIQNRKELKCSTLDTNGITCVPSVIKEMRERDKRIKSLFDLVKAYCILRKADFNHIAVHIAEYRAVNNLIRRFQRETIKLSLAMSTVRYTFEDWLQNKFWREKSLSGEYVANDSAKYLDLVASDKLTHEELNKIQDAQQRAYDYLIEYSLQLNLQYFQRQTKDTLGIEQVVAAKLREINQYFQEHQAICNEVMLPKKHRGIKWGAKFLLPQHYQAFLNKTMLDVDNLELSGYGQIVNGRMMRFPTPDQLQYARMEVQIRWFCLLEGYEDRQRYEEMLKIKHFRELIDRYGREQELMEQYHKGLEFAPDRELYIKKRIQIHEDILPRYQARIGVRDEKSHVPIEIDAGEYKRIGYEWVINGHNAKPYDLQTMTFRNVTLCPTVPPERRYGIYCHVLYQLAAGGALAFHLAFLRQELKKPTSPKASDKAPGLCWQGNEEQRLALFDELAVESFLADNAEDKANFFNNLPVRWNQDGRSLFYLLNQLKEKRHKMLLPNENLGPLVRYNFRDKGGNEFKNISQNMSGMFNANKAGKPRQAGKIDTILRKIFGR